MVMTAQLQSPKRVLAAAPPHFATCSLLIRITATALAVASSRAPAQGRPHPFGNSSATMDPQPRAPRPLRHRQPHRQRPGVLAFRQALGGDQDSRSRSVPTATGSLLSMVMTAQLQSPRLVLTAPPPDLATCSLPIRITATALAVASSRAPAQGRPRPLGDSSVTTAPLSLAP